MSSVLDTLVTDRTQEDVDRVAELRNKIKAGGLSSLTEAEQAEYLAGMKGAYNYTDMNRVGEACAYLEQLYNDGSIALEGFNTPITDWEIGEVPGVFWREYINNVKALRDAAGLSTELPAATDYLSYEAANNIEKAVQGAGNYIENIARDWMYSGEVEAGEF